MKKIATLVAAALITCSLGACGNRNTAYDNLNNNGAPMNTAQDNLNLRNRATAPNIGVNTGLRDGVYLGEGNNRGATGNEAAIVTINGGRITNVVLKSMDSQGKDITYNSTTGGTTDVNIGGTTRGSTPGVNPGLNNRAPGNNTAGTTGGAATGNPNGGYVGGNANGGYGGTYGGTTGSNTGGNATGGYTGGTYGGTMGGTNVGGIGGTTGTTIDRNTGTGTGTASALEIARKDLANAIVRNQTANVNISTNQTGAVNNWKLAVTRALESAKR